MPKPSRRVAPDRRSHCQIQTKRLDSHHETRRQLPPLRQMVGRRPMLHRLLPRSLLRRHLPRGRGGRNLRQPLYHRPRRNRTPPVQRRKTPNPFCPSHPRPRLRGSLTGRVHHSRRFPPPAQKAKAPHFPQSGCGVSPQSVAGASRSVSAFLLTQKFTQPDFPQTRTITPDLASHEKCSYEHSLCPPFTNPAAPALRPSGKSSTTAGTNSSPSTKNYTANPSARSTPPPSPPSNPFSAAATSPPASPARQAGGCRLEAGGDAR